MSDKISRRTVSVGMAAGGGLTALGGAQEVAHGQSTAKTFVLVHGAWHGGWAWRRVSDALERKGHKVFTPTLTGLGERSHLMSKDIDLDTHITDVVNVIRWEGLQDIVLVGHSYAGWVVSGVAEQVLPSIASIVFLDAVVPEDGQKGTDLVPERNRAALMEAVQNGEISRPVLPAKTFGVNEKDQPWVDSKLTPMPIGPFLQPIKLTGARERILKKTYIRATTLASPSYEKPYQQLKTNPAWRTFELPSGHDVMVDMPDRLAEILLNVA